MLTKSLAKQHLLVFGALVLMVAACGGSQTAQQPVTGGAALPTPRVDVQQPISGEGIRVAVGGGRGRDVFRAAALEGFAAERGVPVLVDTETTDLLALLEQENAQAEPLFDLVWLTDTEYFIAANRGWLARVSYDEIGPASDLYDLGRGEYGVASEIGAWGIVYNEGQISEAPTVWQNLLNPDTAPLLGMAAPTIHGPEIHDLSILSLALGRPPQDGGDSGVKQARVLAQQGAQFTDYNHLGELIGSGDVGLAVYSSQAAAYFAQQGLPVRFVAPAGGAFPARMWMAMPANLPEARWLAAQQLMGYAIDKQAQAAQAEANFSGPINKTVQLASGLGEQIEPYGQAEVDALLQPDWNFIVNNWESWLNSWQAAMNSDG